MAFTRITLVFSLTTDPLNRAVATAHTGGWTESLWTDFNFPIWNTPLSNLMTARQAMLPFTASITGYRAAQYDIQKNKLIPRGAFSVTSFRTGNSLWKTDLPQAALQIKMYNANQPNTSSPWLRGMPDDVLIGGEYSGNVIFTPMLTNYINQLIGGAWGFMGRDLSQETVRVNAMAGATLTAAEVIPGVAVGDYIRLNRVYDSIRRPVVGAFQVTAINAKVYTLDPAPGATVTEPSGLVRKDLLRFLSIGSSRLHRAGIKKVGRPSQGYRGRRSRKRV